MKTIMLKIVCFVCVVAWMWAPCSQAGAVGGSVGGKAVIAPYGFALQNVYFNGGVRASVLLSGDGDSDLDLFVYDQFGNLVASDDDATDDCVVTWIPHYTGMFTLKLINRGGIFNSYSWATN